MRVSSVDFVVTFQRGTEWAATGAVTQKMPATFRTADTVSYRADIAAMDPRYANGLDSLSMPCGRSGNRCGQVIEKLQPTQGLTCWGQTS